MKKHIMLALLVSTISCDMHAWSDIDTPLPFRYGIYHYPIQRDDVQENWDWRVKVFGAGYHRSADKAFSSSHGHGEQNEVPFSTLLFGKSEFRLAEAFPNASVGTAATNNPFIGGSVLRANYQLEENGAMFRGEVGTRYNCFTMGLRGSLPFRDIRVSDRCPGDFNGLEIVSDESVDDLFVTRFESVNAPNRTNSVFAARLDLLTSMNEIALDGAGNPKPLVNYSPTGIRIADVQIGGANIPANNVDNNPPVAVIQRNDGTIPSDQRWGQQNNAITGNVAGDGSGLANNQRGQFVQSTDYSALAADSAAQSELYIVPTLNNDGLNINERTDGANTILSAIQESLSEVQGSSVFDFIKSQGLNFCDGNNRGVGDLDLETYLGYDWFDDNCFWSELLLGVRIPTGDLVCDCKDVLKQAVGNNDHVEVHIGSMFAWIPNDRLRFTIDGRYHWVTDDCNVVAAPFKGATIKNIGPCVQAQTEWEYFLGHANVSFWVNECCGFDAGYEAYYKRCDEVCGLPTSATDLLGRENQQLDPAVLRGNTERASHKIRLDGYMIFGDCEINAGWAHAIAGKNIARETDWYLGVSTTF